jgi:hypothetical protein
MKIRATAELETAIEILTRLGDLGITEGAYSILRTPKSRS